MSRHADRAIKLAATLDGHAGPITRLSYNQDGSLLATPSHDGTVRVWDTAESQCVQTIQVSHKAVWVAAWSPDGRLFAAGGRDNTVHVYDSANASLEAKFEGHVDDVHAVCWLGVQELASASFDGTVRVWKLGTDQPLRTIRAHEQRIEDLAWISGCQRILTASRDRTAVLLSPRSGERFSEFVGHRGFVLRVLVDQAERTIYSASSDGTVRVWNLASGQAEFVIDGLTGTPHNLALSADSGILAVKDDSSQVRLYRTDTFELVSILEAESDHHHWYGGLAFHPTDPQLVTTGAGDRVGYVWDYDPSAAVDDGDASERSQVPQYVNCRVALLGDSGVGKSSLALALRNEPFSPTDSTHAVKTSLLDRSIVECDGRTTAREVFLWDFAGQPAYRLLHQFDVQNVAVAVLVFDNRNAADPLSGVRAWEALLRRATEVPEPRRILVAARVDRGGSLVEALPAGWQHQFANFVGRVDTSAKTGLGVDELRQMVLRNVAWDEIPAHASDEVLRRLRLHVMQEAGQGRRLRRRSELYASFLSYCDRVEQLPPDPQTFARLLVSLESQDLIVRLGTGETLLLEPALLRSYASMVLIAACQTPDGLGTLSEDDVLTSRIPLVDEERLVDPREEEELLQAAVEEFVHKGVVLRENRHGAWFLRFPSAVRVDPHPGSVNHLRRGTAFRVVGTKDYIFAALAVALTSTGLPESIDIFRSHVRITRRSGREVWLTVREPDPGGVVVETLIAPGDRQEALFDELLEAQLRTVARGRASVVRAEMEHCPACQAPVHADQVRLRKERGYDWLRCNVCDGNISLAHSTNDTSTPSAAASALLEAGRIHRQSAASQVSIHLRERAEAFDVLLSYNTEDRSEIVALAGRLIASGLRPWLDIWELRPGMPWLQGLSDNINRIASAAVVVGGSGLGPWQKGEVNLLLEQFLSRGCPVIPVLLESAPPSVTLPALLPSMQWVDFACSDPDPLGQLVWGISGRRPGETEP